MLEQLILEGGVTGGVTKWGYISVQLGLHIWGNQGGVIEGRENTDFSK